jgi:LPS export ABC transporter protein LptC
MTRILIIVRAAIGLAAIAFVAVAFAAGCNTPQVSAKNRTQTPDDSVEQVMFGARTVLVSSGTRRGEVAGDTVSTFDAATRFEFHGVHAMFTSPLGRPLGTLTARTGTYRVGHALFDVPGPVTIVSDTARRRLEGNTVRYDVVQNRLSSDSAFVATAGTRRLTGVGFTADPGLFSVKCLQSCTGSLGQ